MGELKPGRRQTNVNVTLVPSSALATDLGDKEFPCPLCGAGLPIRASKRRKPYCTCNRCGVQLFVRGKEGIARMHEMADAGILISGKKESASHGINLLNRLEQLKLQKDNLNRKCGLFFREKDVENAIQIVDAEIERVQGELAKMARTAESAK